MVALMSTLKTVRPWQAGVLVAVLLAAIGATYGLYWVVDSSGGSGLRENQQLIPVQLGDLVNQVSTNGSIVFPNRETLSFGTQGTVGEVFVEEGQVVEEGQILASLDQSTVASLEKSVAQARIVLRDAEDALAQARDPYTPLDIARAEADIADARLTLQNAQQALDDLLEPTSQQIAQAVVAVASSRISLEKAQEDLAVLLEPSAQEMAQVEAAVPDAAISVKDAREALDDLLAEPSEDDLTTARSKIDSADTALTNALRDLALARNEWVGKIEEARESLDAALDGFRDSFKGWLGAGPKAVDGTDDPDTLLVSWGIDLEVLFSPDARFQDSRRGILAEGPPVDDPSTPWNESVVYAWTNLYPGLLMVSCRDGKDDPTTLCIKDELEDSWAALELASDNFETVEIQAAKAVSSAESAVTSSEDSLAAAKESLVELEADPDPLEIESKRKDLDLALANLDEAEKNLANLYGESNTLEVEEKRKQVAVAQANLDAVIDELAKLTGDPDQVDLDARTRQVQVAQASLDEAESKLAEFLSGADPLEVSFREADVASARLALDRSLDLLERAALVAPISGIVDMVNIEEGQSVTAIAPALEVVDPTVIEVGGIVDEIDVLFVRVGAAAEVSMDALPGQMLEGTVSYVALAAETQQGVVSYPMRIQVQLPQGIRPVEGLSATANIVIREDNDVLLVPMQAVYGTFDQPMVRVYNGGPIEERQVSLGNSDDFWVVVLDGLSPGEQVVVESSAASTDPFAQIRQQIQSGGRGGPGGGISPPIR